MRKWIFGVALLFVMVLAYVPVSVQAFEPVYPTPYYAYNQEYVAEHIAYEEEHQMPMVFITTANLNLRQSPCITSTILVTIRRGQLVYVTDFGDWVWFAVTVDGRDGYMYADFLKALVSPAPTPPPPTPTPVAPAEINESPEMPPQGDEEAVAAASVIVERLHWSEARQLTTIGTIFTVIDVRTGITWQMASFSNGNHADVETITAADTAAMLRAWGGRWCWQPRPVHVIIGDRVLAASLNGMPHAGWTRRYNNMNGHVCLHFYGSRTHNGNRSHERDHQNAVNEAFNTAR